MSKKNILAISGSTRKMSTNHNLIQAIIELSADALNVAVFDGLENLPQFNPDKDGDSVAREVAQFRQQLESADGILICTPEYAHGIPGALKNAIDWTISSSGFPHKPTTLITASTNGSYGHRALLETLKALEAKHVDKLQMVIPFAKTKISPDNQITDEKTLAGVKLLITTFIGLLHDESMPIGFEIERL